MGTDWIESMIAIDELGELVGLRFDDAMVAADQYGLVEEEELARVRVRRTGQARPASIAPATTTAGAARPRRARRG